MGELHLESGQCRRFGGLRTARTEAQTLDLGRRRDGIEHGGRCAVRAACDRRTRTARRAHAARQPRGRALEQQIGVAGEGLAAEVVRTQRVVRRVLGEIHRHAGQSAGRPGDRAVAFRCVRKNQLATVEAEGAVVVDQLVAAHGFGLHAGDIDHVLRIDRAGQRVPGASRTAQHARIGQLPALAQAVAQAGPQRGIVITRRRSVGREGQQFDQPGVAPDDVDDAIAAVQQIEQHQLELRRVASGQPAHRFVRAMIGRAQHQQAAVRQLADAPPHFRALAVGDHGAHHETAHRMRHDVQRLLLRLQVRQPQRELFGQLRRRHLHRVAPVVGEELDPVGLRQMHQQWRVETVDQTIDLDLRRIDADLFQSAERQRFVVQPHAITIGLQRTAHRAGQHDGQRFRQPAGAAARNRAAPGRWRRRPLADRAKARVGAVGAGQTLQQPVDRAGIVEVAEVIDRVTLVHLLPGTVFRARDAAEHRSGIHHQIVFALVEPVGHEHLQRRKDGVATFDVAGDHRQIRLGAGLRMVQQAHDGRAGHHRFQAGQHARVGALAQHGRHEVERLGCQRHMLQTGDAAGVEQQRKPAVQPAGGERGTHGRAGDAHEARDPELLRIEYFGQLQQRVPVGGVVFLQPLFAGFVQRFDVQLLRDRHVADEQPLQHLGAQRVAAAQSLPQTQQLADQATARVADQMQRGALRHRFGQFECVLDRTDGECAVFEGINAFAIDARQSRAGGVAARVVVRRQLAETAVEARCRAMQEHQQRLVVRRVDLVDLRAERCVLDIAAIQTRLAPEDFPLEARREPAGDEFLRLVLQVDAEEFDHPGRQTERTAQPAAARGVCVQVADVPQHLAIAARFGLRTRLLHQVVGAYPELEAVVERDPGNRISRYDGRFGRCGGTTPAGLHRAQRCERDFRSGWCADRRTLARANAETLVFRLFHALTSCCCSCVARCRRQALSSRPPRMIGTG